MPERGWTSIDAVHSVRGPAVGTASGSWPTTQTPAIAPDATVKKQETAHRKESAVPRSIPETGAVLDGDASTRTTLPDQ
ncbi:hypothetical protein GCM10017667_39690 [Streptomyces filamentosus]|uniref:Uncharacterized protein n=1 Tax=Streptomyces filamentosus TaxID=67294 RepID=A0A919BPM0_STRFL|nr:hypothetical protein GCM10017667_39690 [Streptomyces filamentosus]